MKIVYLIIHAGYDFDPTTLAVCSTLRQAKKMAQEHYALPTHADFPWNGVHIIKAKLDSWTPQPERVQSFGTVKNYDKLIVAQYVTLKGVR